jgi:transcriptional regulator with XRE-family HTH domain
MPFVRSRLRHLREAKGLQRSELAASASVSLSQVTKHENGSAKSDAMIERFADALDCTMDFLYGRGQNYPTPLEAAIRMSFDVFSRTNPAQAVGLCRRVLGHRDAPRTARAWRSLAEHIELALEESPAQPARRAKQRAINQER